MIWSPKACKQTRCLFQYPLVPKSDTCMYVLSTDHVQYSFGIFLLHRHAFTLLHILMVYGGALPWWPWLSLEAPPPRRPAALLPGLAGRVCPAASTKLSYLSGCTWAWSHMSRPGHQSLDCWPRPKIDERRRRMWGVFGLLLSRSPSRRLLFTHQTAFALWNTQTQQKVFVALIPTVRERP